MGVHQPRFVLAALTPCPVCCCAAPAGSKLLYLGGASGTSVSHCSDLVGPEGAVYAVEFSHRRSDTQLNSDVTQLNSDAESIMSALCL